LRRKDVVSEVRVDLAAPDGERAEEVQRRLDVVVSSRRVAALLGAIDFKRHNEVEDRAARLRLCFLGRIHDAIQQPADVDIDRRADLALRLRAVLAGRDDFALAFATLQAHALLGLVAHENNELVRALVLPEPLRFVVFVVFGSEYQRKKKELSFWFRITHLCDRGDGFACDFLVAKHALDLCDGLGCRFDFSRRLFDKRAFLFGVEAQRHGAFGDSPSEHFVESVCVRAEHIERVEQRRYALANALLDDLILIVPGVCYIGRSLQNSERKKTATESQSAENSTEKKTKKNKHVFCENRMIMEG
jgi:hypothetical protein